jgi:hypothetical protein
VAIIAAAARNVLTAVTIVAAAASVCAAASAAAVAAAVAAAGLSTGTAAHAADFCREPVAAGLDGRKGTTRAGGAASVHRDAPADGGIWRRALRTAFSASGLQSLPTGRAYERREEPVHSHQLARHHLHVLLLYLPCPEHQQSHAFVQQLRRVSRRQRDNLSDLLVFEGAAVRCHRPRLRF